MAEETVRAPEALGEDFIRDPYPVYARLRAQAAVVPVVLGNMPVSVWLVTRHAEARAAMTDPALVKDAERVARVTAERMGTGPAKAPAEKSLGERMLVEHMLSMEPPAHTRLRRLVGKAFTTRRVQSLRPQIQSVVDRLLDDVADSGETDLLKAFAWPLPLTVISEMIGVPEADRADFGTWANALTVRPAQMRQVADTMAEYLVGLIADKRATPTDDLLSDLIRVRDEEDRLSESELVSMVFQLLVAGYETTTHLVGNGMLALLRHPDQFAALRADRSLLTGAIEEFCRYDNPLHLSTGRVTAEPVEIGGVRIPADEFVVVSFGSAHHDPARFGEPDRFDIRRDAGGHLAFGHGIHHCLGAPLARLETGIAIGALLDRFERIELAAAPQELRYELSLTRGLEALPVRLG